jgi:lambda repressor-like predicted transcriptional regulator
MNGHTHPNPRMRAFREDLKSSGRTITWLAEQTGYSRTYLYNLFAGTKPESEATVSAVATALGLEGVRSMEYLGQVVRLPRSYFREGLPEGYRENTLENRWKQAWVKEHGPAVLAREAERAWQFAQAGLTV